MKRCIHVARNILRVIIHTPQQKSLEHTSKIDIPKVSYWKVWMGSKIAKSLVRGTHEHGFKYFFMAYGAWILGFTQMRKVIAVDGTFLRSKYGGVLLSAVAQDAENHIFLRILAIAI
ncbi:hypothetical protein KY290_037259 [Solanum tuberosum]|uniref:Uncharacterized protein n=1 Tax=Solanum tuberosum TaxID=4113 RepID=A0ABQ7TWA6_SOLTU|nr:hypothetical protein KY290_037259 [Solanum tuberosum]